MVHFVLFHAGELHTIQFISTQDHCFLHSLGASFENLQKNS